MSWSSNAICNGRGWKLAMEVDGLGSSGVVSDILNGLSLWVMGAWSVTDIVEEKLLLLSLDIRDDSKTELKMFKPFEFVGNNLESLTESKVTVAAGL